jgi:short-subunit dehydrogenase
MTIDYSISMRSNLKNNEQYALVTGATSGFGYELSKLLALHGYNLVLVGRSLEKLREVAELLTESYCVKNIILLAKDLFIPSAAKEIYRATKDMGIDIDILVNDAGKSEYGKFTEYDVDRDIDIIQLNITSLVSLTKFFLKDMITRNKGKILQISSMLGRHPTPLMSVYAASKAFVLAFTTGLIAELKETNITLTALIPGATERDFFCETNGQDSMQERSVPEQVAQHGFDALMKGESKIISGYTNETAVDD